MTIYYVKNGGNDGANGLTDANAWATCSKVRSYGGYGTGDIVLFKCDDVWNNQFVDMNWGGSAGNYATIGAYYGSGTRGVSGEKPIIDGGYNLGSGTDPGLMSVFHGLITCWGEGSGNAFQQVENMHTRNVYGIGIRMNCPDSIVQDCTSHDALLDCFLFKGGTAHRGIARRNRVWNGGRVWSDGGPGFFGYGKPGSVSIGTNDTYVHDNIIGPTWGEVNTGSCHGTNTDWSTMTGKFRFENNVCFGGFLVGFFAIGLQYAVVRNNIMVGAGPGLTDISGATSFDYHEKSLLGRDWSRAGIYMADEARQVEVGHPYQDLRIYNNLIAGFYRGIYIDGLSQSSHFRRCILAHNTLVDNVVGIHMVGTGATDSEIRDNLIVKNTTLAIEAAPSSGLNNAGIICSHNTCFESPVWSGTGEVVANATLAKSGPFTDALTYTAITADDFALVSGSSGINDGLLLTPRTTYSFADLDYYSNARDA